MKNKIFICLCCIFVEFASAQVINKGYHGFIDGGYSVNTGGTLAMDWYEVNTIHGYQFNPHLFVGGGIGLHFLPELKSGPIGSSHMWSRDKHIERPIFVDLRYTILDKKVTPYADIRLGYNTAKDHDYYTSLGLGCRVAIKNNFAIYAVAAYSTHKLTYEEYPYKEIKKSLSDVSARIGFEF